MSASTDRGSAAVTFPPAGWQLLALPGEISAPVTAFALGPRALVAVRGDDGKLRVFDGTCPHRGAHLGYGGRVVGPQGLLCPFHGKRIGLGLGTGRLCVREHQTVDCDGAIFVRLSDVPGRDLGFEEVIRGIQSTHAMVAAVTGRVSVPPELIIENAFDFTHFSAVHLVPQLSRPKVWLGDDGELHITTAFRTPAPDWEAAEGDFTSDFHARAFSPHLVVSELGSGRAGKFVVTGAVPAAGGCDVRIAIALRRGEPAETGRAMVEGSRLAFEQDLLIWNNLDLDAPVRMDSGDGPVLAFRAFCDSFAKQAAGQAPPLAAPLATEDRGVRAEA